MITPSKGIGTNQVLQLASPQCIILVEWMLVRHSLQAEDFLLLSEDLDGGIVENGLDCLTKVSGTAGIDTRSMR